MNRAPDRTVAVTFAAGPGHRTAILQALEDVAELSYLGELFGEARRAALSRSEAVMSWQWEVEIRPEERSSLDRVRFVQLLSAGVDGVPLGLIPSHIQVASNVGAFSEPIAEHVMAMVLALMKRLPQRHAEMAGGEFHHFAFSRSLDGAVCGILGYGGIGRAVARLMRSFGARIHAVNTSGRTDDPVEFVGTFDDLPRVLEASDVLVIALPLTERTRGLIGRDELALMKPEGVLVNVARGAIVDQDALFERLQAFPAFSAGLDVWWDEPLQGGSFRADHPFLELPNVVATPHNSALVPGSLEEASAHAARNVRRYLMGEEPAGLVRREDYRRR